MDIVRSGYKPIICCVLYSYQPPALGWAHPYFGLFMLNQYRPHVDHSLIILRLNQYNMHVYTTIKSLQQQYSV